MVQICSEHAIGFLKGQFQLLKGLHINIKDADTHKFATYWIVSCIGIHSFAMDCEEEDASNSHASDNSFIQQGLTSESDEIEAPGYEQIPQSSQTGPQSLTLVAGRQQHKELKKLILDAKEQCRHVRESSQNQDSSESD